MAVAVHRMGHHQHLARVAGHKPSLQAQALEAVELDLLVLQPVVGGRNVHRLAARIERHLGKDVAHGYIDGSEDQNGEDQALDSGHCMPPSFHR